MTTKITIRIPYKIESHPGGSATSSTGEYCAISTKRAKTLDIAKHDQNPIPQIKKNAMKMKINTKQQNINASSNIYSPKETFL